MNQRIDSLREYILSKQHHSFRRGAEELGLSEMSRSFAEASIGRGDRPPERKG